jgi:APA family basic amino acid/polyamine antiporter
LGDASRLTPQTPPGLLRILGLGFGVAAVLGDVIGSGILRAPGLVASYVPSPSLIIILWTVGGLFCLIEALSWIELSASIPRAGGPYVYVERAYGRLPGFLAGWTDFLVQASSSAFIVVVFAEYLVRAGVGASLGLGPLAVLTVLVTGLLQSLGTRVGGWSSVVGSALKATLLVVTIGLLFVAPPAADSVAVKSAPIVGIAAMISAFRAIVGTYSGWMTPVYFAEEIHDPHKNIARSMLGGLLFVTFLYVAINVGLLHALPMEQLAASKLPVADAAARVLGDEAALALTIASLVIVATIANLQIMFTPRITYGMARDGLLPKVFAQVSANGTPQASLWLTVAVTALLAATGAYDKLLAIYAPLQTLVQALVCLAAMRMRAKEPDLERPFRMPLFPVPALLAFLFNAALAIAFTVEDFANARWSIVLLVAPLPLYVWARRRAALT